jgi:hypothetical protein
MPPASQIVCQQHVANSEDPFGAVAQANLYLSFQRNHILAKRSRVPIEEATGLIAAKVNVLSVLNCRPLRVFQLLVWQVYVFKMRLAVVSGIDANNLHGASIAGELG